MVWSVFKDCWVLNEAYEFLNNPSHQIRLYANENICATYEFAASVSALQTDYAQNILNRPLTLAEYFEKIYHILQKTFQMPVSFYIYIYINTCIYLYQFYFLYRLICHLMKL